MSHEHSPDTFDDEELTQMAMDILIDIKPKQLESNTKTHDLHYRSQLFHHRNDDEGVEVHTKSIPPSSTITSLIDPDPNTLHAAYPKPKLSILSSNQLSSSDSLNISLPPLPTKQQQQLPHHDQPTILSNPSSNDSFNIPLPPIPTQKPPMLNLNIVSCDSPIYRKRSKKLKHRSMNTPPPTHSSKPYAFQRSKTVNFVHNQLIDVPSSNLTISPRQRTSIRRQSTIPNFGDDHVTDFDEYINGVDDAPDLEPMKMQKHKSVNKGGNMIKANVKTMPNLYGKHFSIYIDFDQKERRKRKRKKKKNKKRSMSPDVMTTKSRRLKKYKKRDADRHRAKSVVSFKSQVESVSYMNHRIKFDRYSNFKQMN